MVTMAIAGERAHVEPLFTGLWQPGEHAPQRRAGSRYLLLRGGASPVAVRADVPTHAHLPRALAARLRTGCYREEQYLDTYTIMVTRSEPTAKALVGRSAPDEWWPVLAPSFELVQRGWHQEWGRWGPQMAWPFLACRYWNELQALSRQTQNSYIVRLGRLLKEHPSVTLLSGERTKGREEQAIRSQRAVLFAWLLGKTLAAVR